MSFSMALVIKEDSCEGGAGGLNFPDIDAMGTIT